MNAAVAEQPAIAAAPALTLIDAEPRPAMPLAATVATPPARTMTPGDLLAIAQQQTPDDLDRLERLLVMQERWLTAERARAVEDRAQAADIAWRDGMRGFREENVIIPKTKQVDQKKRDGTQGPKFSQAEFDEVCRRLSPALAKHGFSYRHDQKFGSKPWPMKDDPNNVLPWVTVRCILEHVGGRTEVMELEGPGDENPAMSPVQRMQATASYLKRQSLLAMTGTATAEEDDENKLRGGNPNPKLTMLLVDLGKTATDAAALSFWQTNRDLLRADKKAYDEFKAAVEEHRTELRRAGQ